MPRLDSDLVMHQCTSKKELGELRNFRPDLEVQIKEVEKLLDIDFIKIIQQKEEKWSDPQLHRLP